MNLTHYVDLVRHVTGAEAEWVSAVARTDDGAEVEDAVALTVAYDGGGTGSLAASAGTRGAPGSRFEVWGDTGTIQLEPEARVYTERAVPGVVTGRWNALPGEAPEADSRTAFVERFAAAVLAGERPDVTAADGLAVQAFVEAAYRSVQEGGPVRVETGPPGRACERGAGPPGLDALPAGAAPVEVLGEGPLATLLRGVLGEPPGVGAPRQSSTRPVTRPARAGASPARLSRNPVLAGPPPSEPVALDLYSHVHVRGLTVVGVPEES